MSAACFAIGTYSEAVVGAILFQISAIVDCVDGDLARVLFKESRLGKWLDIVGDQVVHIGVFICIAVGLWRANAEAPLLWLGASAAIGAGLSFLVILRGMRLGESERPGMLQLMIDRATNRDFSVLVLALALVGFLEWFLWMAAIGSHVFWILALSLQPRGSKAAA
jgi:phosphatidylglycerophosphate synthase